MSQFVNASVAMVLLLAVAASARRARAEVFVLKSGGRVEAELLNPSREPGSPYQLRTGEGLRLDLAEGQVNRVIVKSDLEKEYEVALTTAANTVEGQWQLAEWCKEAGLIDLRKKHLQAILRIDPNHKEARTGLGHSQYNGQWMTQEEYMTSRGYVRYKGAWSLKQQIELDARDRVREQDEKDWRKQIRTWLDQIGTKRGETASTGLMAIREPTAAPALREILADPKEPRGARLMCLDILSRLPPGMATATLIKLAMEERDDDILDKCLDELIRQGPESSLPAFLKELQSKDNKRVNRAAYCLGRLGDAEATLPLINALVTKHEFIINSDGGGGGGGGSPISFGAGGGAGQGGLGGLNVGGKPKRVKVDLKNEMARTALTNLHPGVNYNFDVEQWRNWYIQNHTSTNVDLRRGE